MTQKALELGYVLTRTNCLSDLTYSLSSYFYIPTNGIMLEKQYMQKMFDQANSPSDLPWHTKELPPFLVQSLNEKATPGGALDVGCGAGAHAVLMAQQNWSVTGLDYLSKALEFAAKEADHAKVKVNWVCADVLLWQADKTFDIILDSGCLHNIHNVKLYKKQLLSWLSPSGDFILGHWGRRGFFDWRPIGPIRRSRETITRLFSPELTEVGYSGEVISVPLPIGPTALLQGFRFKRTR